MPYVSKNYNLIVYFVSSVLNPRFHFRFNISSVIVYNLFAFSSSNAYDVQPNGYPFLNPVSFS